MFRDLIDDLDGYSVEPNLFLDVPFVPTDEAVIKAMLDLAGAGRDDVLYDLGSGDGRIVIAAARDRGTRGIGIELDPLRIADAMEEAGHAGVEYMVDFVEGDIFTADIREASIVTLYLMDSVNVQLRPRLLEQLRPGTRIVSHAFDMGDWPADERLRLNGFSLYKWIVPAQVAGTWEWTGTDGTPYRVELQQTYQKVTGQAWRDGRATPLQGVALSGNRLELRLQADGMQLPGSVLLTFAHGELQSVLESS